MSRGADIARGRDAEAAAWLVRLDSDADAQSREAHEAWLAQDEEHARAFERAEEVWSMLPRAAAQSPVAASHGPGNASAPRWAMAACLALVMLAGAFVLTRLPGHQTLQTAPGEQAVERLADGSTASLDTMTRVSVDFDDNRRALTLDEGEAVFDVAHDAERPFIVRAGTMQVRAVGTRFVVRHVGTDTSVTLLEGRIAVSRLGEDGRPKPVAIAQGGRSLRSGERLRLTVNGGARSDRRAIEDVAAWRRGRVVFDDVPLGEAVSELNRYGGERLAVGSGVAGLAVSGSFSTADPASFAEAVSALHNLHVRESSQTLVIESPVTQN
ncbi:FecR family protein [Alteriqipengyuania lutimaris]|uniref:DUF4880 domain-containing protein n=1 Tax=Alteriqipengyuania lutimaris TaxID=1538146 RepID=A0A395LPC3_9SPHN|nr:FecR domain-containing protein [Alteriqipengyuania lutimaris]MBB3033609.1 transmembrane sensor [Alteriqipengyuania lutimaris]RDS77394.1 DUF4880 domain-containing protein [Alteriqipengyuania lutimaris]